MSCKRQASVQNCGVGAGRVALASIGVALLGAGALATTPQAPPAGAQPQVEEPIGIDEADSVAECAFKRLLGIPCDTDPEKPE